MKRKILGLVAAVTLSTGAFAASDLQIGSGSVSIDGMQNETSYFVGADGANVVKTGALKGTLIGIGGNINVFSVDTITATGGAYTMAADLLVGYTFKESFNIPLTLKAGIGYGVTRDNIVNKNSWAPQYSASAAFTIYKGIGLGVRYNTTKPTLLGVKRNIKSTIGYLNIAY